MGEESDSEIVSRPIVGVSSCLLGNAVRYDGRHKRHRFVADEMPRYFELEAYCPEFAIGMGIPRSPIRLTVRDAAVVALGVNNAGLDVTEALCGYGRECVRQISGRLSGFVFKRGSPSCGQRNVSLFDGRGGLIGEQAGLFAMEILSAVPLLPMIEECGLEDAKTRVNFITRVHVYHRWHRLRDAAIGKAALIAFHSRHKYLLMAHSIERYRALGRLLADIPDGDLPGYADAYFAGLMAALALPTSRGRHANVLTHLAGYLKRELEATQRQALAGSIDAYRQGDCPLIEPLGRLQRLFETHRNTYLADQVYLYPYPGSFSEEA